MSYNIPVSIGEILDKLTILDIKKEKIKNNTDKLLNVTNEYNLLYNIIINNVNFNDILFLYKLLKNTNYDIWIMQDKLRELIEKKENKENILNLCIKIIIDYNDRRFRIKKKINIFLKSELIEEKSYICKVAFHIGDLGLGDQINQIGCIRYLSTLYDKVIVTCKKQNEQNLLDIFSDDKDISLYVINEEKDLIPRYGCNIDTYNKITENKNVYITGCNLPYGGGGPYNYIVTKPYEYLNLNFSIFWNYFFIPKTKYQNELFNLINNEKYIFIHNTCSTGIVFTIENIEKILNINRNDILFINPCVNVYDSNHIFFEKANKFINKNITYYIDIIENAEYVILSDSSFFCMSLNLEIKTNNCFYISRWHYYDHIWTERFIFDKSKVKRQIFKKINI